MTNTHERRTSRLEYDRDSLKNDIKALQNELRKLQEDAGRQRQQNPGDGIGTSSLGITTSSFSARNGNVFPSGTVKLTYPAPSSDGSSATNTDQSRTVTAYNWTGGAVDANKLVYLVKVSGVWLLISQDCSNVAVPAPASAAPLSTQANQPIVTQTGQQTTTQ